jgi:translocator protein
MRTAVRRGAAIVTHRKDIEPKEHRQTSPIIVLLLLMLACYGVGFLGNFATIEGLAGWYQTIQKPAFTPPAAIFAPVWTILYGLMGWAAFLVWREPASRNRTVALVLFALQLALNGLWPWLFFAWNQLALSFYEIVFLDIAVLATIGAAAKVHRKAAWLLIPYLAWVLFATLLGFSIWRLNPYEGVPKEAIPPGPGRVLR